MAAERHLQVYEPFLQEVFQALREASMNGGEIVIVKKTVDIQRGFSQRSLSRLKLCVWKCPMYMYMFIYIYALS